MAYYFHTIKIILYTHQLFQNLSKNSHLIGHQLLFWVFDLLAIKDVI
jgi:hypothetical protein